MQGASLLRQAKNYLDQGDWFDAPEHAEVSAIEREALANGLRVIDDLSRLRSRVPIDRLVEEALDRTGYRLHLLLLEQPKPRLANLQRFIRILEGYRNQTVGTFLEIWARWEGQDLGIPQAPLYSKKDDVVTLSTIHGAKGLEWPVVFLVDNERAITDRKGGTVWSDRVLGPILCPKQDERGPACQRLGRARQGRGAGGGGAADLRGHDPGARSAGHRRGGRHAQGSAPSGWPRGGTTRCA